MKVLVLLGGTSPERAVSLRSGFTVSKALRASGHTVVTYDTREGLEGIVPLLPTSDVVFPCLHGKGGEDGTVQQLLEEYHIPYVGADVSGSQHCYDKIATKETLVENGLPTPKWAEVDATSFMASPLARLPYVLKPRFGGSSIDTFIMRAGAAGAVDMSVFKRYDTLLLEELITGVELTASVLGDEALPIIEIVPPPGKEFDYANKYNGETRELCPAVSVSPSLQEDAQSLAEQAHQMLGVRHYSRVDIMMSASSQFYILEVNTIPGMTLESLFPKAAAAAGMPMEDVVHKLINMAVHGSVDHY